MIELDTQGASIRQLERIAREVSIGIVPDSISRALNRATTATRTRASSAIRQVYNVPAAEVRGTFRITRASRTRPEALIESRGVRLPLSRFGARQTRRGVTLNVRRSTGRRLLSGGFFGQGSMPSSRLFRREGSARLPVEQLFGPAVPQMLQESGVERQVLQRAEEVYLSTLEHELRRRIDRAVARANR
ncbi:MULTISPECIES: phage tail protein [unclassified Thioalkalivibrio]|uniref:phage tail protein n=1 Tax=unclassified Thioalkalivibrio TaxID=2621013 RepID=UPI0003631635|nr:MULTISPECIES: phage tail protein [unclassified Thioalkalivibrio]